MVISVEFGAEREWGAERELVTNYNESRKRVEFALERALRPVAEGAPPRLARALVHAVFPVGALLRPTLGLAVAGAYGDPAPSLSERAAVGVELLHTASLVHDDMPCFDDAPIRRGRPTVHAAFGESTALLVGDALIVRAFGVLTHAVRAAPVIGARLIAELERASGASGGIIAGQAWESEVGASVERVHLLKTAALFEAAAAMGAIAAGTEPDTWRAFGRAVGMAYQAADDILDATSDADALGKAAGQDARLGRPSVVRSYGLAHARRRLAHALEEASARIPNDCQGDVPRGWLDALARRLEEVGR